MNAAMSIKLRRSELDCSHNPKQEVPQHTVESLCKNHQRVTNARFEVLEKFVSQHDFIRAAGINEAACINPLAGT